jgi:hypothetical protein
VGGEQVQKITQAIFGIQPPISGAAQDGMWAAILGNVNDTFCPVLA